MKPYRIKDYDRKYGVLSSKVKWPGARQGNRRASIRIRAEYAGTGVLDFLCCRFTYHDRGKWTRLIRAGNVRINDRETNPLAELNAGDELAYVGFDEIEPPVCEQYDVLYEDEDLLVINKPGNLPCHPGGRYFRHTLWHLLTARYRMGALHFINRLDRETSGIVLVAKTLDAGNACRRQFESGSVQKQYRVAVYGDFPLGKIGAQGGLSRDMTSSVRKKQRFIVSGAYDFSSDAVKFCQTDFQLLARNRGLSLLAAFPVTGRLHQIRTTLFSMGYPVVGDKLYGPDDTLFLRFIEDRLTAEDKQKLILSRQALHAYRVQLLHPVSGRKMDWIAPLPAEIESLFNEVIPNPEKPDAGMLGCWDA
ncbi:MAG: RluA family pseudouridine synthase [Desulfobacterales bacterium]|jgi:23S rRNA pseudouridine955/2504/2580 synthase/23S rRNA pseudouridine1911/1915/1917 synthase|nr:RluA family pseudouridine synthase [Desulfobacterales bacterium]